MAGTNILVRQKDLIAGSGISITPDTTSGNVTIAATNTAIDEARLLPTGGRNGNLLEYQEGVDRGNNVNTKLLLQPATSDGLIVDQAAGNAAPVGITNSGNVAIATNALVFSGENALIIEPDTLGMTLGGNNEYSIEVDFQLDQVKSDWATLFGGDGSMTRSAFYINSSGATAVQGGIAPDTTGWTTGTRHRLTIERFQDGDSWKTVIYRNGAVLATSVTTPNTLSGDRFPIGSNLEGTGRNFVGKIWAFRISNKAEHRGVSFAPRELPFLPPAGQPVWTEGIDRSRLLPENPANGDIPVYDATVTGGGIDEYTQVCFHFDETDGAFKNAVDGSAEYVESTATYSAQGKFGGAAEFSGSQRIKYSKAAALNWGAGQGTVDGWFYPNGTQNSSNALIATPGSWSSGGISIGFDRSNTRQKFSVWMKEASGDMAWSSTEEYPRNAWYHWALVRASSTELLFFVNGKKVGTIATTANREINWAINGGYCTIGYNEADSNAGVIGRMDEVRFSNTARWTEDFTPPDAPYSEQVTEGRWRKLPGSGLVSIAAPANGDIPCFDATATIGGGNDANTRLLLQPSTSDHGIVDQAAGNAAPVTLENHNVTVDEEGNMVFDGSNAYLKIPANTLPSDFFNGTDEWTLDIVYNVASKGMQCLFGCSSSLRMDFLLDSDGTLQIGGGPNLGTGWPFNEDVHLTFEIYKDGTVWKYTIFRNGSVVTTGTWVNADWRSVDQYIGWEGGTDSRKINGKIKALRLTSGALHKGAAFQSDYPWTKPQTVGEWGKFNKSKLVQSVNGVAPNESGNVILDASTIIDNSRLLPVLDALPEGYEGSLLAVQRGDGKVADENTLRLMHFNDDVRDVVTDETGTLKGNASITPTGYFAGALSINHAVVSSLSFNGLTATPTAWTMDFRVKLGRFSGDAPIVMIGTNLNETQTSLIRVDSSYIDIQATYNQRVIYKTHSLQLDTWYHFALTYDGTTYKFYVDGKLFGSGESTNQFDFTRKLWFGSFYDYSTSYVSDCTIDEFRLSNVVRWTENFTPPDAPYGESLYNWGIGPKLDESRLLPDAPSDTTNSYWLNSGPVTTQVSPASYAGSTDATWTMELSGTFEGGDIATLFDSDTTNGVSGTLGLETFGTVRWIRKDQVPYRIDQIVLRAQTSDIGAFPQTIYLSGYDKSTFSTEIVQEFNAPVWETESNTSTAATSFTRVCTLDVNAPAFQSYDYSIALGSGAGMETTLQAFAAYQIDTDIAWKQLNTATTTTAGLMAAADKAAIAGLTAQGIYPNVAIATAGSGIDYNLFKTQGTFYIPYYTVVSNGPVSAGSNGTYPGGFLSVLQANLSGGISAQQIFHLHANNKAYIRSYNGDTDTWSAWQRLLTDTEITESKTSPGYFKLPGGMIVQWGKKTAITRDEENCYISFPIAFPTMFLSATAIASSGTLSATGVIVSLSEASTTSMTMVVKNHPNTGSPDMDQYIEMYWFAVGF